MWGRRLFGILPILIFHIPFQHSTLKLFHIIFVLSSECSSLVFVLPVLIASSDIFLFVWTLNSAQSLAFIAIPSHHLSYYCLPSIISTFSPFPSMLVLSEVLFDETRNRHKRADDAPRHHLFMRIMVLKDYKEYTCALSSLVEFHFKN